MNKSIFEEPSKVDCTKCKFFDKNREYDGNYSDEGYNGFCTLSSIYIFNPETRCSGFR